MLAADQKAQLTSTGWTDEQVAQLDAIKAKVSASQLDWQAVWEFVLKEGPTIVAFLLKLFNIPWPPVPTP